ncbi:TonB-dependent receptor [Nitrospirillum sp. BR 11164]|uniref:TonB-dependent receptor n=1 Tax=Nitrospirillum sp. BR 11164 TaxID=3104324 RepID=UPI002AFEEBD0|nr:TonB-dependent receptor [Nitrospirillum sp. BR 11164]MEA1652842.1 TonB-dependent receptor [Nitrospirillum sp. BR 11164]
MPQAYVKNAASATIDGGELELSAKPARGVELTAFLSYTNAAYSSFAYTVAANPDGSGSRTIDASSYAFAGTPRFQYGATARYELPLNDRLGTASAQVSYYRQSRMAWSDSGEDYAVTQPYGLTDVRLDWREIAGHPLDLGFYVRNLFDVHYKAMGASGYQTTGFIAYIPGAPRTLGGTLTVHF